MTGQNLYTRFPERRLGEALADSPIAGIHGPRQCGKTTLAQMGRAPDPSTAIEASGADLAAVCPRIFSARPPLA